MSNPLFARLQQGHRTMKFPAGPAPALPERFRGRPMIQQEKCPKDCSACVQACPTAAVTRSNFLQIDMGKCLFCGDCADACSSQAITFSNEYRLAARKRDDLIVKDEVVRLAESLEKKMLKVFGRSLKLRQVSAGGCNACEADSNVLTTIGWDLSRFGISFVASPRHADGLLITGPVTENMRLGLEKTYAAVADPKFVIAVGSCAISGGIFAGHRQQHNGSGFLPIDLYIPGCPPHPLTILDGLLRLLGRVN